MSLGEKKKRQGINSQIEGTQRLITTQFLHHIFDKKLGSREPQGHASMKAADLETELSDYENTAESWNAFKKHSAL